MRSFGMAATAAGLGFLALALAACTHVPLLIAALRYFRRARDDCDGRDGEPW